MSVYQLRGAAASLCPSEEPVAETVVEEPAERPESPEPLDEATSHEQRAQALRALLLARKRKQPSTGTTG